MSFDETDSPAESYGGKEDLTGVLAKRNINDPRMPIRRKLEIKLELLRKEASEIEAAIQALDKNPEFEKLHDTLVRVSRFF